MQFKLCSVSKGNIFHQYCAERYDHIANDSVGMVSQRREIGDMTLFFDAFESMS